MVYNVTDIPVSQIAVSVVQNVYGSFSYMANAMMVLGGLIQLVN